MLQRAIQIDCIPKNHDVNNETQCSELVFLSFALSLAEFTSAQWKVTLDTTVRFGSITTTTTPICKGLKTLVYSESGRFSSNIASGVARVYHCPPMRAT